MFSPLPAGRATLPDCLHIMPALHELRAPAGTAAHLGLALLILTEFWGQQPVLWVSVSPDWYPPGLAWAGLNPRQCLFAQARDDVEALGAVEIALRGGMAGVVECRTVSRLSAKRLALAARQGGSIGVLLRHAPAHTAQDSTAFATRWMVHPAPDRCVRAELLYAKGAMPGTYVFELGEVKHGPPPAVAPMRRVS